jgi:hypothetical protein
MRLLKKLLIKFAMMLIMVAVMGAAMRFAKPYIMKSAGMPEGTPGADAQFSSQESDLMATVFKSALRLFTGSAKREELAGELSDQLYGGRPGADTMAELGIELEQTGGKPSADPALAKGAGNVVVRAADASVATAPRASDSSSQPAVAHRGAAAKAGADAPANGRRDALLARVWEKAASNPELSLIPVVLCGMVAVHCVRRRRSPEDDFALPDLSKVLAAESDAYDMQHPVHSLTTEEFELLVAMVFQRQGYRVTMPGGLGGGRGGDFILQRKSERLLVQCKKLRQDDSVSVERVRELHEAALAAGVTRGMYVASGAFSWDARNFTKVKGVTMVNARTLDTLITEALATTASCSRCHGGRQR